MTAITSVNPATGKPIRSFDLQDDAAVDAALEAAARAQRAWRRVPVGERVALLTRMAAALRAGKARYAEMIVREMGKPVAEAEAEIEKCAYNCDFYAEHAPAYLADEPVASNASESVVAFEPLGVVLVFSNLTESEKSRLQAFNIDYVTLDPAGDPSPDNLPVQADK